MKTVEAAMEDSLPAPVNAQPRRPAYDPNNLSAEDAEARKYDDTSDGIDWDEIIATTQDDFEAGRFTYNSADYSTQEEADEALDAWLDGIVQRVEKTLASLPSCGASG